MFIVSILTSVTSMEFIVVSYVSVLSHGRFPTVKAYTSLFQLIALRKLLGL